MSDIAIRVENLSKQYQIGEAQPRYYSLREQIADGVKRLLSPSSRDRAARSIWALKDVSFDVKQGEVLGIIGRNGAGKSTLLKILSQITEPTEGRALIYGRVGSLLEVGTGFHPELTGRENVYMNGTILGMTKAEIDRKFDEIVDFSGVEKFIDTPVKRYSSGMQVRLAFAVAAHLEPEILVVDEVLAVGDIAFQKKCLGKMDEVTKEGRTVLFVSHDMGAITRLCPNAIWLESGMIQQRGKAQSVVQAYIGQSDTGDGHVQFSADSRREAQIESVEILTDEGVPTSSLLVESPINIRVRYLLNKRLDNYRVGFQIRLPDGLELLTSASTDIDGNLWTNEPGEYSAIAGIPPKLLMAGKYVVTVFLGQPGHKVHDIRDNALVFYIEGRAKGYAEPEHGLIATPLRWKSVQLDEAL